MLEVVLGHVRVGEAVGGDDAFVGLGAVVDDGVDLIEVLGVQGRIMRRPPSSKDEDYCVADSRLRLDGGEMGSRVARMPTHAMSLHEWGTQCLGHPPKKECA